METRAANEMKPVSNALEALARHAAGGGKLAELNMKLKDGQQLKRVLPPIPRKLPFGKKSPQARRIAHALKSIPFNLSRLIFP